MCSHGALIYHTPLWLAPSPARLCEARACPAAPAPSSASRAHRQAPNLDGLGCQAALSWLHSGPSLLFHAGPESMLSLFIRSRERVWNDLLWNHWCQWLEADFMVPSTAEGRLHSSGCMPSRTQCFRWSLNCGAMGEKPLPGVRKWRWRKGRWARGQPASSLAEEGMRSGQKQHWRCTGLNYPKGPPYAMVLSLHEFREDWRSEGGYELEGHRRGYGTCLQGLLRPLVFKHSVLSTKAHADTILRDMEHLTIQFVFRLVFKHTEGPIIWSYLENYWLCSTIL